MLIKGASLYHKKKNVIVFFVDQKIDFQAHISYPAEIDQQWMLGNYHSSKKTVK